MARPSAALVASFVGLGVALAPALAQAAPQGTAGLTAGVAGVGTDHGLWDGTVFHLGARGDLLLGRDGPYDFGAGPYAEILTHAFDEAAMGGGLSVLVPVLDPYPIVLSGGGYLRAGTDFPGIEPGVAGTFFWGTRSFNYHGTYGMAAGLLAELRYGLGDTRETAVVLGLQLDIGFGSIPLVALINLGDSPEAAELPAKK